MLVCLYVPWNDIQSTQTVVGFNKLHISHHDIHHGHLTEHDCNPTAASLDQLQQQQQQKQQHPMNRVKRPFQTLDMTFSRHR